MRTAGGYPSLPAGTPPSFRMNSLISTLKHLRGGRNSTIPILRERRWRPSDSPGVPRVQEARVPT